MRVPTGFYNDEADQSFTLHLKVTGPTNEPDIKAAAMAIAQDSLQLKTALAGSKSLVCIIDAIVESQAGAVPAELAAFLGPSGRVVGMYAFDLVQPCVLQYICVCSNVQRWGFGSVLLQHFEHLVSTMFPGAGDMLYLAASPAARTVQFYKKNNWEQIDVALEMDNPVTDAAEPMTGSVSFTSWSGCPPVRIDVLPNTIVMRKPIGGSSQSWDRASSSARSSTDDDDILVFPTLLE